MREFPKSLYFSASWQDQDRGRTRFVASLFASKGFLLVGDHPDNRNDPEHYPKRVAEILQDCSGFVIFWPKRDTKQTTSPFMFPEPLYAGRSGLPMFVLYEDGVQIDVQHRDGDTLLLFGGADQASPSLDVDELTATGYSDQQVLPAMSIRLSKPPAFVGPIKVPANPDSFEHHKPAILGMWFISAPYEATDSLNQNGFSRRVSNSMKRSTPWGNRHDGTGTESQPAPPDGRRAPGRGTCGAA